MCLRLPRACGAEDEGCWRLRAMGMLRMERILLSPKEWRIGRAQTPQGALCQRPTPGASRSWGVLVPSGYGGSEVRWNREGLSQRRGGAVISSPWPRGGPSSCWKSSRSSPLGPGVHTEHVGTFPAAEFRPSSP